MTVNLPREAQVRAFIARFAASRIEGIARHRACWATGPVDKAFD